MAEHFRGFHSGETGGNDSDDSSQSEDSRPALGYVSGNQLPAGSSDTGQARSNSYNDSSVATPSRLYAPLPFDPTPPAGYPASFEQGLQSMTMNPDQTFHPPYSNRPNSTSDASQLTSLEYGLFNASNADENLQLLSQAFYMRRDPQEFFQIGKVFACLWTEPVGETTVDITGRRFRKNWLGGYMYSNTQRFVVIRPRHDHKFSFCLPIKTYGHKGTSKEQSGHHAHAIIYTGPIIPEKLTLEAPFSKAAILMIPLDPTEILTPDSRLNFAKSTPVEHNLRVKNIGYIDPSSMLHLLRYYEFENNPNSVSPTGPGWGPGPSRRLSQSGYPNQTISRPVPGRTDPRYGSQGAPQPGSHMQHFNPQGQHLQQPYPQGPAPIGSVAPQTHQELQGGTDIGRDRAITSPDPRSRNPRPSSHNRSSTVDKHDRNRKKRYK